MHTHSHTHTHQITSTHTHHKHTHTPQAHTCSHTHTKSQAYTHIHNYAHTHTHTLMLTHINNYTDKLAFFVMLKLITNYKKFNCNLIQIICTIIYYFKYSVYSLSSFINPFPAQHKFSRQKDMKAMSLVSRQIQVNSGIYKTIPNKRQLSRQRQWYFCYCVNCFYSHKFSHKSTPLNHSQPIQNVAEKYWCHASCL